MKSNSDDKAPLEKWGLQCTEQIEKTDFTEIWRVKGIGANGDTLMHAYAFPAKRDSAIVRHHSRAILNDLLSEGESPSWASKENIKDIELFRSLVDAELEDATVYLLFPADVHHPKIEKRLRFELAQQAKQKGYWGHVTRLLAWANDSTAWQGNDSETFSVRASVDLALGLAHTRRSDEAVGLLTKILDRFFFPVIQKRRSDLANETLDEAYVWGRGPEALVVANELFGMEEPWFPWEIDNFPFPGILDGEGDTHLKIVPPDDLPYPMILESLGGCYLELENYSKAVDTFNLLTQVEFAEVVSQSDPGVTPSPWFGFLRTTVPNVLQAKALIEANDLPAAESVLKSALEHIDRFWIYHFVDNDDWFGSAPDTWWGSFQDESYLLHLTIGKLKSTQGKLDEAIGELGRALWLDPRNSDAFSCRSLLFAQQQERRLALADLVEGIYWCPTKFDYLVQLILLLLEEPSLLSAFMENGVFFRSNRAARLSFAIESLSAASPDIKTLWQEGCERLTKPDHAFQAIEAFEQAVALNESSSLSWGLLAIAQKHAGDPHASIQALSIALAYCPANDLLLLWKCQLLEDIGDYLSAKDTRSIAGVIEKTRQDKAGHNRAWGWQRSPNSCSAAVTKVTFLPTIPISLALSSNGHLLATSHEKGLVCVWDTQNGKQLKKWNFDCQEAVTIAFSDEYPDAGNCPLLYVSDDDVLNEIRTDTFDTARRLLFDGPISHVSAMGNFISLEIKGSVPEFICWNLSQNRLAHRFRGIKQAPGFAYSIDPIKGQLARGYWNWSQDDIPLARTVDCWDLTSHERLWQISRPLRRKFQDESDYWVSPLNVQIVDGTLLVNDTSRLFYFSASDLPEPSEEGTYSWKLLRDEWMMDVLPVDGMLMTPNGKQAVVCHNGTLHLDSDPLMVNRPVYRVLNLWNGNEVKIQAESDWNGSEKVELDNRFPIAVSGDSKLAAGVSGESEVTIWNLDSLEV